MRCFYFAPPVGDPVEDMEHSLDEAEGNVAEGFRRQAEYYEKAAQMCRRMAGIALETQGVQVIPDLCRVWIDGPAERLETLVQDGLLGVRDFEDDEPTSPNAVPKSLTDVLEAVYADAVYGPCVDCADEGICADHD